MSAVRPTVEPSVTAVPRPRAGHDASSAPRETTLLRMTGLMFEANKCFVLPACVPGIRRVRQLFEREPARGVLVSGHTDRAGAAAHNLALSLERAQSVAAFLQDDVAAWLAWFDSRPRAGKRWGMREDQFMLSAVHDRSGTPYYAGAISGTSNDGTRMAWRRFRVDRGLSPGGSFADGARAQLVERYMAIDGAPLPAGTTIVTHGCGEAHPAVPTANGVALAENGRVEVFFFRGPIEPAPVDPCPEGGCPQYLQWIRGALETHDVRFESAVSLTLVDELGLPLSNTPVRVRLADGSEEEARTDAHGRIRPKVPPGASYAIVIDDVHEGGVGSALLTASGQHFAAEVSTP